MTSNVGARIITDHQNNSLGFSSEKEKENSFEDRMNAACAFLLYFECRNIIENGLNRIGEVFGFDTAVFIGAVFEISHFEQIRN